jgi:hypothetical protein
MVLQRMNGTQATVVLLEAKLRGLLLKLVPAIDATPFKLSRFKMR